VETLAQALYLRTLNCNQIQGYYFSKPLPAADILQLLESDAMLNMPVAEHKQSLLLVYDDPHVLASLKTALQQPEAYEILTANGCEEALDLLARRPVSVILCDQSLPTISGTEFLSRVKLMHPRPVRMILTGDADLSDITEAANKGEIYKYHTKPWDDATLRSDIREAFGRYEMWNGV